MERKNRLLRAPLTVALVGFTAACGDLGSDPSGPLIPAEDPLNPQILSAAWTFDVVGSLGKVFVTPPSSGQLDGLSQSIIADYFGLEPGHPELSILGGDVVELTPSALDFGVPRALPGVGSGFVRDVSWQVEVRNLISGIELIAPTFPAPPAGVTTPILIPYNQVVTVTSGSVNCEVGANPNTTDCFIEAPSEGNVFVSDQGGVNSAGNAFNPGNSTIYTGPPHSFFNDEPCEPAGTYYGQGDQSDCRPYRPLLGTLPGGATAAPVAVNYTLDQTVNQFRVQILLAADIIDGTPDTQPPTITSVTAPGGVSLFPGGVVPDVRIGNGIVLTAAGTDDRTAPALIQFSFDSNPGNPYTYTCTAAGPATIAVVATDGASNSSAPTNVQVDCVTNAAPVANAGGPYATPVNTSVTVTGAASTDDVGIATYEWDLDNNGIFEVGPSASPTTSYLCGATPGTFTINLRVTDTPEGAQSTDAATVECTPPANIFAVWTDNAGALITGPVATGTAVRLQICTSVSATQAFQTDLLMPAITAGIISQTNGGADLNPASSGAGACADAGATDVVDQYTGGAAGATFNFQNFSISPTAGSGIVGLANIPYTAQAVGTVTPNLSFTSPIPFTWQLFSGTAPTPVLSAQVLTIQ